jgi:branched-chain amino acid transport system ATP-binding protein
VIVQKLADTIRLLRGRGYTILMVEQNFRFAAPLADRFYVIEHGRVAMQLDQRQLHDRQEELARFLGV